MKKRRSASRYVGMLVAAMIGTVGAFNYMRPLPMAAANAASLSSELDTPSISWPVIGEAAIGASGYGLLANSSPQSKIPTASLAKVITALTVLQAKPLSLGEQGPSLVITPADVALYNKYVGEGGSVVRVTAGEQLTEYQALQAMLLPSANNVADTLAIWAFGSLAKYQTTATALVQQLHLKSTVVGSDASGFSPDTVSTPADLVNLGAAALQNPVVAQIVAQTSAQLPVVGTVRNANADIGIDGIDGIKVGNVDQDRGAFLFAAKHRMNNGQNVTIIGAVMGQPNLHAALDAALPLLKSAEAAFSVATPVTADQVLATYTAPDGRQVNAVAKTSLSIAAWRGAAAMPHLTLQNVHGPLSAGAQVGTVSLTAGDNHVTAPIVLDGAISAPTFWGRVLRF